jgi:Golgi apparatus protein 1
MLTIPSVSVCPPGSPRELISRLAVQRSAQGGTDWYNSKNTTPSTELVYSYRFKCDDHYYGVTCEDLCRPRDDQFGHYYCSNNGTKVCLDGWQGDYCDRGEEKEKSCYVVVTL